MGEQNRDTFRKLEPCGGFLETPRKFGGLSEKSKIVGNKQGSVVITRVEIISFFVPEWICRVGMVIWHM